MTQEELFGLLHEVAHPELHNDIVTLGMVENPVVTDDKIQLTLLFPRSRDPFALSIKKRCEELDRRAGSRIIPGKSASSSRKPRRKKPPKKGTETVRRRGRRPSHPCRQFRKRRSGQKHRYGKPGGRPVSFGI